MRWNAQTLSLLLQALVLTTCSLILSPIAISFAVWLLHIYRSRPSHLCTASLPSTEPVKNPTRYPPMADP